MKAIPHRYDPHAALKEFTRARIAIGRAGISIPLQQSLDFKLAHAHARDAVYSQLDEEKLFDEFRIFNLPILSLRSKALTRQKYLKRPDLGRLLDEASATHLESYANNYDLVFIIADGLSATAINENAFPLLELLLPVFTSTDLKIAPLCLAEQARVALGDDIASRLGARFSVMLIGERPGLSAADSMGVYLTYNPRPGLTDETRNCVSNIRLHGLKHQPATDKIIYLVTEALRRKLSGIALKDNAGMIGE